jgi:hypothetical protein
MLVTFQVLTATSMMMAVFWNVAPCSLVDIDRRFRGAYRLNHQGDVVNSSETSVSIYQSVRRNIPQDSNLQVKC